MNSVVIQIVGYLTNLTCQALEIKPHTFFLGVILSVSTGGAFTLIGTSANIIIADYAGFDFVYYLLQFGWFALIVFAVTLVIVFLIVRHKFAELDSEVYDRVKDFDPWMMVPSRRVFWAYTGLFVLLIAAFVAFPDAYLVALA